MASQPVPAAPGIARLDPRQVARRDGPPEDRAELPVRPDRPGRCAVEQLKIIRKIWQQPALEPYHGRPRAIRFGDTDEAMLGYAKVAGGTLYHAVGTVAMGDERFRVVDPQLRVRGVEGLRVIDASVMPQDQQGNTNAPDDHDRRKGRRDGAAGREGGGGGVANASRRVVSDERDAVAIRILDVEVEPAPGLALSRWGNRRRGARELLEQRLDVGDLDRGEDQARRFPRRQVSEVRFRTSRK